MIEHSHAPKGTGAAAEAMNPTSAEPGFQTWMADVRRMARKYLGVELESLPELPYRDGFDIGDTPAEFYVGAVLDAAALLNIKPEDRERN
jgi:hypothetical protein